MEIQRTANAGVLLKLDGVSILLDGLSHLEYRGYDSAGIALSKEDGVKVIKCAGRVKELRKLVQEEDTEATCGMGHTRWATHGGVSDENAKQILAALSGEWTGAMWLEDGADEKPLFMAAVECSDHSIFDLIIAYLSYEMGATIVGDDVYALNVNRREEYNYYTGEFDVVKDGLDYYVMYKNNSIMIMPENLFYRLDNNGNIAKNNPIYSSMNNNLVVDVEPIRSILTENVRNSYYGPSEEETIALEVMNMFKSLTADFNLYNLDIRLNLENDNVNSLKCVVDKILGFAARYMK